MEQWEYRYTPMNLETHMFSSNRWTIEFTDKKIEGDDVWRWIGHMGEEGWELVSVVPLIGTLGSGAVWTQGQGLWFRRSLRPESPQERAEREAIERSRLSKLAEEQRAYEALPKGKCPNCKAVIPLSAAECPQCRAAFGPESAWKVLPLKDA
jgi:hypothetical protein